MKLKCLFFAAVVAGATALFAADSIPLSLTGVLTLSDGARFGLVNQGATRSVWAKIGDEFEGYVLKKYDGNSLSLEKDGKTFELNFKQITLTGEAVKAEKATLADAEAVVAQINFEKMLEKTMAAQQRAMERMMRQQTGAKGGVVDTEALVAHQKKIMDVMLQAMEPAKMKDDMVKIYSELFTKSELQAMAQFNVTPAGQALIEKQPEVQQKLQELMMPRVMSAMPKIQQLTQEFAKEQREKKNASEAQATQPPATPGATAAPSKESAKN